MLKRGLTFLLFLFFSGIVCREGLRLMLFYFVLFPFLLFGLFYFFHAEDRTLFFAATALVTGMQLVFLFRHPSSEIVLLSAGSVLFMATLAVYRWKWKEALRLETVQGNLVFRQLEALKIKHQSRLESLQHLEKQVTGLLNLFETARDFSESLSFQSLTEILYKKVMPELPFRKMSLILLGQDAEKGSAPEIYRIDAEGIQNQSGPLSAEEHDSLEKTKTEKGLVQKDDQWLFPLLSEDGIRATLVVEGAQKEDLVKFEVLGSYLALQVKKIRLYETVKELSIRDGLTGVFVRRHFLERFEEELKRSMKFELPLAVLMLDIDQFKRYNDEHGHLAGDATLKQVAQLLRENLRKVDIVARYGGEEFVAVIPETEREGALEVAERIRSNMARYNFKVYNAETRVTVSLGAALFPSDVPRGKPTSNLKDLALEIIHRADSALYRAKEEGRNRVVLFQDL